MRHPISLAHLTVLDTTPPELVTVAAAAGFRTIGIRLTATPSVGVPPYDILRDGPVLRETLRRLEGIVECLSRQEPSLRQNRAQRLSFQLLAQCRLQVPST